MSMVIETTICNDTIDDNFLLLDLDQMSEDDVIALLKILKKFEGLDYDCREVYFKLLDYCKNNQYEIEKEE